MKIESIRHKALRNLTEKGAEKGLIEIERLRRMLTFIGTASSFEELTVPPNFGFHPLTGARQGTFALTVTRNWRMTFTKIDEQTIGDLDLEDYH